MSQIIHISRQRFAFIRSMGYQFATSELVTVAEHVVQRTSPCHDDVDYHLLSKEHDFCESCGDWFWSIDVNSPVELETIKVALRFRQTPEQIVEALRDGRQQMVAWQHQQLSKSK